MKGIVNYTRWKYTVSLKEWLQACKISKQKLYSMLTEIIDAEVTKVIIGEAYTTRYEVYTSTGFHCYVAFEKIHKEQYLVLLYEEHYESYMYRWKPSTTLELTFEKYDYSKNGIDEICFSHSSRKTSYHMSTIIIGGEIEIGFTTRDNMAFCKIINSYQEIFDELTKYKITEKPWGESIVDQLFILYKMILKEINKNMVLNFNVERPFREYLRYEDGRMRMRVIVKGENYVRVSDEKGDVEWEENLIHHETFTCFNGRIYGHKREVTDEDYAQKILSGMKEGKEIYEKLQQELKE